jgi:hypothetical protein
MLHLTWFENKRKDNLNSKFKLNQVHLPQNHCRYMRKNYRLQHSGYSDTWAVTALSPNNKSQPKI